jgi:hypothetical protein
MHILIHNYNAMFCPVEVVIGLDRSSYNVNEDAQRVSVCASVKTGVQMESRDYPVAIRTKTLSRGKCMGTYFANTYQIHVTHNNCVIVKSV